MAGPIESKLMKISTNLTLKEARKIVKQERKRLGIDESIAWTSKLEEACLIKGKEQFLKLTRVLTKDHNIDYIIACELVEESRKNVGLTDPAIEWTQALEAEALRLHKVKYNGDTREVTMRKEKMAAMMSGGTKPSALGLTINDKDQQLNGATKTVKNSLSDHRKERTSIHSRYSDHVTSNKEGKESVEKSGSSTRKSRTVRPSSPKSSPKTSPTSSSVRRLSVATASSRSSSSRNRSITNERSIHQCPAYSSSHDHSTRDLHHSPKSPESTVTSRSLRSSSKALSPASSVSSKQVSPETASRRVNSFSSRTRQQRASAARIMDLMEESWGDLTLQSKDAAAAAAKAPKKDYTPAVTCPSGRTTIENREANALKLSDHLRKSSGHDSTTKKKSISNSSVHSESRRKTSNASICSGGTTGTGVSSGTGSSGGKSKLSLVANSTTEKRRRPEAGPMGTGKDHKIAGKFGEKGEESVSISIDEYFSGSSGTRKSAAVIAAEKLKEKRKKKAQAESENTATAVMATVVEENENALVSPAHPKKKSSAVAEAKSSSHKKKSSVPGLAGVSSDSDSSSIEQNSETVNSTNATIHTQLTTGSVAPSIDTELAQCGDISKHSKSREKRGTEEESDRHRDHTHRHRHHHHQTPKLPQRQKSEIVSPTRRRRESTRSASRSPSDGTLRSRSRSSSRSPGAGSVRSRSRSSSRSPTNSRASVRSKRRCSVDAPKLHIEPDAEAERQKGRKQAHDDESEGEESETDNPNEESMVMDDPTNSCNDEDPTGSWDESILMSQSNIEDPSFCNIEDPDEIVEVEESKSKESSRTHRRSSSRERRRKLREEKLSSDPRIRKDASRHRSQSQGRTTAHSRRGSRRTSTTGGPSPNGTENIEEPVQESSNSAVKAPRLVRRRRKATPSKTECI